MLLGKDELISDEENTESFVAHCDESRGRKTIKRRKCILSVLSISVAIFIVAAVIAYIMMSPSAKSERCFITDKLKWTLEECTPGHDLESLLNATSVNYIGNITKKQKEELLKTADVKSCQENQELDDNNQCVHVETLTQKDLEYIAQAEEAWDIAWEILHDERGWRRRKGNHYDTGIVSSKKYSGIGTVSKIEAYVDTSCEGLFKIFHIDAEKVPEWNKNMLESKILEQITPNVDIQYLRTAPLAGGMVSSRDYVTVQAYKRRDNKILSAGKSTKYPSKPASTHIIRGYTGIGGMLHTPVDGNPDKCLMQWIMNTQVGGWVPQWAVDETMTSAMMDMFHDLKERIRTLQA